MNQAMDSGFKARRDLRILAAVAVLAMVLASFAFIPAWEGVDGAGDSSSQTTFTSFSGDVEITYRITGSDTVAVYGDEENRAVDSSAKYVEIPATVTYKGKVYTVTAIDPHAFDSCKVAEVLIPDTVSAIGNDAFAYCFYLSAIEIPDSIVRIEDRTFLDCSLESFTVPDGVVYIGEYSFMGCGFETFTMPDSVTTVGYGAFFNCFKLKSVDFSSGLVTMGPSVFSQCKALESAELPEGLTSISDSLFSECVSLSSVTIPSTVKTIDCFAFMQTDSLKTIFIPPTVEKIDPGAFTFSALETVYVSLNTDYKMVFGPDVTIINYDVNVEPEEDSNGSSDTVVFAILAVVFAAIVTGVVLGKEE